MPMPTITKCTRSVSACISVRMPQNFLPASSRSFGQRRSGARPVSSSTASRTASPASMRDQRRDQRRNRRAQQDGHVDAAGLFRMPGASGAPSPGGLLLGQNDGAVRLAGASQIEGDGVGRAGFEEMMDALAEDGAVQLPAQQAGRQHVGHAFDLIAGARMALDAHAERAQPLRPVPHRRARDADFPRDFLAADDDQWDFRRAGSAGRRCAGRSVPGRLRRAACYVAC